MIFANHDSFCVNFATDVRRDRNVLRDIRQLHIAIFNLQIWIVSVHSHIVFAMSAPLDAHAQSFRVPASDTSALNDAESDAPGEHHGSSMAHKLFSENLRSKPSYGAISHRKRVPDEEGGGGGGGGDAGGIPERPLIPSALEHKSEPPTTPLPKLPMIVLSIVCFLSHSHFSYVSNLSIFCRRC